MHSVRAQCAELGTLNWRRVCVCVQCVWVFCRIAKHSASTTTMTTNNNNDNQQQQKTQINKQSAKQTYKQSHTNINIHIRSSLKQVQRSIFFILIEVYVCVVCVRVCWIVHTKGVNWYKSHIRGYLRLQCRNRTQTNPAQSPTFSHPDFVASARSNSFTHSNVAK